MGLLVLEEEEGNMTDKPLTEQDIITLEAYYMIASKTLGFPKSFNPTLCDIKNVQSAKRLAKQMLKLNITDPVDRLQIDIIIDRCFDIPDGDENEKD